MKRKCVRQKLLLRGKFAINPGAVEGIIVAIILIMVNETTTTSLTSPFRTAGPMTDHHPTVEPSINAMNAEKWAISQEIAIPRNPLPDTPRTELSNVSMSMLISPKFSPVTPVSNSATALLRVSGSLKRHSAWWHKHERNPDILGIIDRGYILPFHRVPEPSF